MERKIGEVFEYEDEWYQCVRDTADDDCRNCDFDKKCKPQISGGCSSRSRVDGQSVAFKKLEKVGEPMWFSENSCFQRYALPIPVLVYKGDKNVFSSAPSEIFLYVEIEQKQTNMEKKELNLKPFNLEAAKAGKPVCTRDGRKVRIVCFDVKGSITPIIALVADGNGNESTYLFHKDGRAYDDRDNDSDLMMLPEKHEGWINLYKERMYGTKEEAIRHIAPDTKYICTIKAKWEE